MAYGWRSREEPSSFYSEFDGGEWWPTEYTANWQGEVPGEIKVKDEFIKWVQQSLNTVQNSRLVLDGDLGGLGSGTRKAVQTFQRAKGLPLISNGPLCPDTELMLSAAVGSSFPVRQVDGPEAPGLTFYVNIPLQVPLGEAKSMTGIYIPANYCPVPEVDLIVYLHGFKVRSHHPSFSIDSYWSLPKFRLRDEVNKSQKNVILVAPTLGPKNEPGSLTCPGGFDRFLERVREALKLRGPYAGKPQPPGIRNIILACHSGSGEVMRKIAMGNDMAVAGIQECWAFEPSFMGNAATWKAWAAPPRKTKLHIISRPGNAGEDLCKGLIGRAARVSGRVDCITNISAEITTTDHDEVPMAFLQARIKGAPFLLNKSSCAVKSKRPQKELFIDDRIFQSETWEQEASRGRSFVRDFSGPAAECTAALRRAGKTKAQALAIINTQIRVAITMLRKASSSLKRGSRTTTTRNIFRGIFRVNPEFVPDWLKQTATIKDRGDVVSVRCKRVADLLASGRIKYFCTINSTNCPDCGNDSSGFGCSSWGDESVAPRNSRVVCLGDAFWDDMKAGNTVGVLATLMHEPFHIFYGKYVTEHVMDRGKFGGIDCIVQFVFERNRRTAPTLESDGCAGRAVRREIATVI